MKKTVAARETAETMHAAEEALQSALEQARAALVRMQAAKIELGMTGTVGDAAIAQWAQAVAVLEEGWEVMTGSHREAYQALTAVSIRGVAFLPTNWEPVKSEEARAA